MRRLIRGSLFPLAALACLAWSVPAVPATPVDPELVLAVDLDSYYELKVIGGAGAFSMIAEFDVFAPTILRKLVREIAESQPGAGPGRQPAETAPVSARTFAPAPPYAALASLPRPLTRSA